MSATRVAGSITYGSAVAIAMPKRFVELTIDGEAVKVVEGTTLLTAAGQQGREIPTLCYGETLTPKNACRVCMVEVEGSRTLVPSCSRKAEAGMVVHTDSERARHSRRMVLELLGSSVDLSTAPDVVGWNREYGVDTARHGVAAAPSAERDTRFPDHPSAKFPDGFAAANVHQPLKRDNELYVRDYGKCILCYKCVDACGPQAQNTFAIGVAGRGFNARISTEFNVELPDSACVYCGNCIAVCPTGALMFASEYDMRADGSWNEAEQTQTDTICPYCGVGCTVTLHVQDNEIIKVTSPLDHSITSGNLCIKGRFGFQHVQNR
jgi:predicted molibdopterin-dependent oxidoreductase YjgC